MKKQLVGGLLAASLAAGCAGEQDPERVETMELTLARDTFAYDPAQRGEKGDGNLGQSERPLKAGELILAECIDGSGDAQAVRVAEGDFADMLIPLVVFEAEIGGSSNDPLSIFTSDPAFITGRLDSC